MIVQCQNCDTRFQLDESRVPAGGVRVRCSRCKESFFLAHPGAKPDDVVHGIAEDAAREGEPASPEVTRDLPEPSTATDSPQVSTASTAGVGIEVAEASPTAAGQLDTDVGPVLGGISEDEDWQFNEEIPEVSVAAKIEVDPEADGVEAFGSVDDFSSLIADVAPLAETEVASGVEFAESAESVASVESAESADLMSEAAQQASAEASVLGPAGIEAGGSGELATSEDPELGDPEDWNFFSDTPSSDYQPPPTAAAAQSQPVVAAAEAVDELASELGGEVGHDSPTRRAGWTRGSLTARVGGTVGWLATISLVVIGLTQGLFLETVQPRAAATSHAVGSLVVDALVPSWIENQYQGRILAVHGRLFNPTSRPVAQEQSILVALLDGSGVELATPPALVAVSLSKELIRELPADELRKRQLGAADALARSTLAPGQSIAFTALFEKVPAAAKGVGLQTGLAWSSAARSAPDS